MVKPPDGEIDPLAGTGPSDEELFVELFGSNPSNFSREAQHRLTQASGSTHHPEDLGYAHERGEEFIQFVADLLQMAEEARRQDENDSGQFWKSQRSETLATASQNLIAYTAKIRRPGKRGVLLEMVIDIAEAAFRIGQWMETTPEATKKTIDDGNADRYRRGGLTRAEQRTAESGQWQAVAKERAKEMLAAHPNCLRRDITDAVLASWPSGLTKRSWDTVDDYLRKKVLNRKAV